MIADPLSTAVDAELSAPVAQAPVAAAPVESTPPAPLLPRAPGADPLADAVDSEVGSSQRAAFLRFKAANAKLDPQRQADVFKYAAASGLSPDLVAANLEGVKREVDAQGVNWELVSAQHPELAEFVAKPGHEALVAGDMNVLQQLSRSIREGFSVRALQRETLELQTAELTGTRLADAPGTETYIDPNLGPMEMPATRPMTPDEVKGRQDRIRINEARLAHANDFIDEMDGVTRQVAKLARLLTTMGPEMVKGTAASIGGAALGAGVGGAAAGTAYWSSETAGPLFWQLREMKGPSGEPLLTEDEARGYALAGALPTGLLMSGGPGAMLSKATAPMATKLLAAALPKTAEKLLASETIPLALRKFALDYGSHAASGALAMAGQSAVAAATMETAKSTHGEGFDVGNVTDAFGHGFTTGLSDFWALSLYKPFRGLMSDLGRVSESQNQAAALRDVAEGTRTSKLATRSPEKFEELVNKIGPGRTVYVTKEAWDAYFTKTGEGVSPREVAAKVIGDEGQGYDAATSGGGDVAVPLSKWATKMVLAGHDKALALDVRSDLGGMTERQTVDTIQRLVKLNQAGAAARAAAAALGGASPVTSARDGGQIVYTHPESPMRLTVEENDPHGEYTDHRSVSGYVHGSGKDSEALHAPLRGKGFATESYVAALVDAKKDGKGWVSDKTRSDASERMYQRLIAQGVPFKLVPVEGTLSDRYVLSPKELAATDLGKLNRRKPIGAQELARALVAAPAADTVEAMRARDRSVDVASLLNLTPEERAQLEAVREQKYAEARARLDVETAKSDGRGTTGALRDARESMRAEAHASVSASPLYRAHDFLRAGELLDPGTGRVFAKSQLPEALRDEAGRPVRLDGEAVLEVAGKKAFEALRQKGMIAKKGGMHPDEFASLFAPESSGKELALDLAHAEPKDAVVERETTSRFEEAFGPALAKSHDALVAVGEDGLHNAPDIEEAVRVHDALARALRGTKKGEGVRVLGQDMPMSVLRMNAKRIVDGTRVDTLNERYHLDAERGALKRAFGLMTKAAEARDRGQQEMADRFYEGAYAEYDNVILNKLLWRAARDRRVEVARADKRLRAMAEVASRTKLGKADASYADGGDAILQAAGFLKGREGTVPNAAAFESMLARMERDAAGVARDSQGNLQSGLWDAQSIRDLLAQPHPFETMTVDEALNLRDAVENIRHAAAGKTKVDVAGRALERAELLDDTAERAKRLPEAGKYDRAPGKAKYFEVASRVLSSMDANLTNMEDLVSQLVGGDREAPLWKLLVGERLRARDYELQLSRDFLEGLQEKWDAMPKRMRDRANERTTDLSAELPLPEHAQSFLKDNEVPRSYLWMIALNLGNAGNKQRMLDGYGWSERQVMDALQKRMTKAEWLWVQDVWNSLSKLYPHIERVHREDTGLAPERIEATPLKVRIGAGEAGEMGEELTLAGGYFPARYDSRVPSESRVGEKQEAAGIAALMSPNYRGAKTATTHAQARSENATDLLNLDWRVVPAHVSQVLHDVAYRKFVKQVGGLFLDPRFESLVQKTMGKEYAKQFMPWLKAVASQQADSLADSMATVNGWVASIKSKVALAACGFNLAIPLSDLSNPLMAFATGDVSAKHLALVTVKLAAHYPTLRAEALRLSPELRYRAEGHGNSVGLELGSMAAGRGDLQRKVETAAYWAMERTDAMSSTSIWLAKFNELSAAGSLEAEAVRDADATLRKFMPAHDVGGKAALLRDKGFLGAMTFLYGFANRVYGMHRQEVVNMLDAWREPGATKMDKATAVAKFTGHIVALGLVVGGVGDFLANRGPSKPEDAPEWALKRATLTSLYGAPILGPAALSMIDGKPANMKTAPGFALIDRLMRDASNVKKHIAGTAQYDSENPAMSAMDALFILGGSPGFGQARKTGGYVMHNLGRDLERGRYGHVVSGLTYGQQMNHQQPVSLFNMWEE